VGSIGTWHHGLVADWWVEFNTAEQDLDYFGRFLETGQPALDAGCGSGRLLLPWLRAGYDVDGCDMSADMIDRCRNLAQAEGLAPNLWVQALHELTPPRPYATIVVCGVFGLGSTREQDKLALQRLHECLEPGGTLLLDNQAPYAMSRRWPSWTREGRAGLPEPWPPPGERSRASDGSERELRVRALSLDPIDQTIVMEIRADKWVDGDNVASEVHTLSMRMYFHAELLLLLEAAGFAVTAVDGDHRREPATADSDFLVYTAQRR
jgi:SAM-dependent methyltransferase